jgi:uncharacterized membrane protein
MNAGGRQPAEPTSAWRGYAGAQVSDGPDNDTDPVEPRRGRLSDSSRVEAFSDGVLAIVITLLVLDLRAPAAHFLTQLSRQWPAYLAYLASFGYVGVIWVNHHQLFTRIAAVDSGLLWRNLALLLSTSVLPFPTAVLGNAFQFGSHADQVTAFVLYALVAAVMAVSWLLLFHYLSVSERLLEPNTPSSFFVAERRRALLGLVAYLLAAALALVVPVGSLAIVCVLPVFYGLTSEGWTGKWLPGISSARSRSKKRARPQ